MSSHANAAGWDFIKPDFAQGLFCAKACAGATLFRTHFLDHKVNLCPTPSPDLLNSTFVGVQWSTDVTAGTHAVTLVLCTHIPLSLNKHVAHKTVLAAVQSVMYVAYKGTLLAGAILSAANPHHEPDVSTTHHPYPPLRQQVFLTLLGGGTIAKVVVMKALNQALAEMSTIPLDVVLCE
jgi:hypothetical protein